MPRPMPLTPPSIESKDHAIVSASPELFFQLNGEQLLSKPMKGTTPRGMTSATDLELRQELQDSYKNRAENVMITDMVRNDLGPHCESQERYGHPACSR